MTRVRVAHTLNRAQPSGCIAEAFTYTIGFHVLLVHSREECRSIR